MENQKVHLELVMGRNLRWRPESKRAAIGLWLAALGILIQAATGAKGYPKIPTGIIILTAAGFVLFRWGRYLVILDKVTAIRRDLVCMGKIELPLSEHFRKNLERRIQR